MQSLRVDLVAAVSHLSARSWGFDLGSERLRREKKELQVLVKVLLAGMDVDLLTDVHGGLVINKSTLLEDLGAVGCFDRVKVRGDESFDE